MTTTRRGRIGSRSWFAGTNTYVIVGGSLALKNHLAVRNTLRDDAGLRTEYGELKKCLGATASDIYEYGAGKTQPFSASLPRQGSAMKIALSIDANQVAVTERRR